MSSTPRVTTETPAQRQAAARAVPERCLGLDPPIDLESDFSRVGPPKSGLMPAGAWQRMMDIRAGRVKPKQ